MLDIKSQYDINTTCTPYKTNGSKDETNIIYTPPEVIVEIPTWSQIHKEILYGKKVDLFCEIKILIAMTFARLFYAKVILNRIYFDTRVSIAYYGTNRVNITHFMRRH